MLLPFLLTLLALAFFLTGVLRPILRGAAPDPLSSGVTAFLIVAVILLVLGAPELPLALRVMVCGAAAVLLVVLALLHGRPS